MRNKLRGLNLESVLNKMYSCPMEKFKQVFLGNFDKIPFISYKLIS